MIQRIEQSTPASGAGEPEVTGPDFKNLATWVLLRSGATTFKDPQYLPYALFSQGPLRLEKKSIQLPVTGLPSTWVKAGTAFRLPDDFLA